MESTIEIRFIILYLYCLSGSEAARELYGITGITGTGEITSSASSLAMPWVAHGFTDGDMAAYPYGDNQWALCVTCGAWAALSVWEHLLHTGATAGAGGSVAGGGASSSTMGESESESEFDEVLYELVNTLKGVALFFREYMWRQELLPAAAAAAVNGGAGDNKYIMHTGPTTSPENSYLILLKGGGGTDAAVTQGNTCKIDNKYIVNASLPLDGLVQ